MELQHNHNTNNSNNNTAKQSIYECLNSTYSGAQKNWDQGIHLGKREGETESFIYGGP